MSEHDFITIFTQNNPVGKEFGVDAAGQITKTSTVMFFGTGVKVHVPDAEAFGKIIKSVGDNTNQVIMLGFVRGIPEGEHYELTIKENFANRLGYDKSYRGELPDFFVREDGFKVAARLKVAVEPSTWTLIDRDETEGMPDELVTLDRDSWLGRMDTLLPGITTCGKVITDSSSARMIVNGQQYQSNNMHVYVQVEDYTDVERIGSAMLINSFDQGLGYRKPVGSDGTSRPWSIFDPTTFSRERLNYESKPVSTSPYITVAPSSVTVIPGSRIDTSLVKSPPAGTHHGMEMYQSGDAGGFMTHDKMSLTLDTVIETKDDGFMTIRQWRDSGMGHTRVQSPTRPDSVSWNAYMDRHKDGNLLCFDNGSRTKYTVRVDVNELLAGANILPETNGVVDVTDVMVDGEAVDMVTGVGVEQPIGVVEQPVFVDNYQVLADMIPNIQDDDFNAVEQFVNASIRSGVSDLQMGKLFDNLKEHFGCKRDINALVKKTKAEYRVELGQAQVAKAVADNQAAAVGGNYLAITESIEHSSFPDSYTDDASGVVKVKVTINNTYHLLQTYGISVRYNQITKRLFIEHALFSTEGNSDQTEETSLTYIIDRIRFNMLAGYTDSIIMSHLGVIAMMNEYNPVTEYIRGVVWDGVDRLEHFYSLISVDSEQEALRNYVVRKWLIQACAAADGAESTPLAYFSEDNELAKPKYEYVLILQGAQGMQKTKFFSSIMPVALRTHFKEGVLLDPSNTDSVSMFVGHWINELGELDATFTKSDLSHLKAFLSNTGDLYRKPYAKTESHYKRRSVACATVNPRHFLKDSTGNRRFWVLAAKAVTLPEQVGIDLDQLWAQVFSLYMGGEAWWPNREWQVYIDKFANDALYMTEKEEAVSEKLHWAFGNFTEDAVANGQEMFAKDIADKLNQQSGDHSVDARMVAKVLTKINRKPCGEPRISGKTHGTNRWMMPQYVGRPLGGIN